MMSRISGLPSVTASHWEVTAWADGKTFPEPSWLVVLREGLPGLPFHSLSRRAAQLFFRVSILTRKRPARKKFYDRLKPYRVTKAPR